MKMKQSVFIFLSTLLIGIFAEEINAKGSVPLDSWTFDKVTSKFPVSIVKFDVAYPYGPKHDAYTKMAEAARSSPDILVAEVGVKDYGDKDNSDLAERFSIPKDRFPVVKLLVPGKEPSTFDETTDEGFTTDNLIQFIRSKSGKYIGLPGCLEEFDKLASKFNSASSNERKVLIKDAQDLLTKTSDKKTGETYIKMMQKQLEKGDTFIDNEIKRVKKLMNEKITPEKKTEMSYRINILNSFKDEL